MNAQTDQQLLQDYAGSHSEPAFAELVRRHIDFVFSAALRMVYDSHQAEDVTQSVFVALAQNAPQLAHHPVLSGWLHRTTQNLAANAVRTNVRRQTREQEAVAMNELLSAEPDANWENIAPHLDAALGELSEPDRDAVLLRYFERKSAHEMAQTLGISDEAAQKRVNRAVERLREFFAKRGVTVGASGLIVVISANAVQAAPVGLAVTISTAAALAGATFAAAATTTAIKTIAMTTLQKTIVTATVAILAGAGIYEARQASQQREQNQMLQQQQAGLAEQTKQLQSERDHAIRQLDSLRDDIDRLNSNNTELLKLRAEVTRLRAANYGSSKTQDDSNEAVLKSWLARAVKLKQIVEQNADKTIPDLQLLSENDWLGAARDAKLDTDKDVRQTMANLRHSAENIFAVSVSAALAKYMDANNRQFPTDLSQLQTYFDTPMDEAILRRWQIVPQSDLPNQRFGDWLITQKSSVDEELDQKWAIGPNGYGTTHYPSAETASAIATLDPLVKAYTAANNGKAPTDPSQILPLLTTPEQQAAYQTLLKHFPTNGATR